MFPATVLETSKQKEIAGVPVKHKRFLMRYLSLKGFPKIILNVLKAIVLSSRPSLPKYLPS